MGRYLMFISYIGTQYSGLQAQYVAGQPRPSVKTVCGVLEKYLRLLSPQNEVRVITSSRTDAQVHAFRNAVHVDLIHKYSPEKEFQARSLMVFLNRVLMKDKESIRVLEVQRVNDDFNSRFQATCRWYVYRLAICQNLGDGLHFWDVPVTPYEFRRVYFRLPPFNLNLFLETAEALSGTHFYNAFTTPSEVRRRTRDPIRTVEVNVKRGSASLEEYQPCVNESFQFWDVHVKSFAFVYKMVRRMVGTMLSVAEGRLDLYHVKSALSDPHYTIPPSGIKSVPGYGLYLKEVQYSPEDLVYTPGVNHLKPESLCSEDKTESCNGMESGSESDITVMENNREHDVDENHTGASSVEKDQNSFFTDTQERIS